MAWAGLDVSGNVDVDLASQFGLEISDTTTDESNLRFKNCLAVACAEWEKATGREYASDADEARTFQVSHWRAWMYLPLFRSVASVEILEDGNWTEIPDSQYSALKKYPGRGTYDSLYHTAYWQPGLYRVTARWGEEEAPESAVFGAVKYASYLFKIQQNPSGVGTFNNLDGGVSIELERIPGNVYQLMMSDKLASSVFPRSN